MPKKVRCGGYRRRLERRKGYSTRHIKKKPAELDLEKGDSESIPSPGLTGSLLNPVQAESTDSSTPSADANTVKVHTPISETPQHHEEKNRDSMSANSPQTLPESAHHMTEYELLSNIQSPVRGVEDENAVFSSFDRSISALTSQLQSYILENTSTKCKARSPTRQSEDLSPVTTTAAGVSGSLRVKNLLVGSNVVVTPVRNGDDLFSLSQDSSLPLGIYKKPDFEDSFDVSRCSTFTVAEMSFLCSPEKKKQKAHVPDGKSQPPRKIVCKLPAERGGELSGIRVLSSPEKDKLQGCAGDNQMKLSDGAIQSAHAEVEEEHEEGEQPISCDHFEEISDELASHLATSWFCSVAHGELNIIMHAIGDLFCAQRKLLITSDGGVKIFVHGVQLDPHHDIWTDVPKTLSKYRSVEACSHHILEMVNNLRSYDICLGNVEDNFEQFLERMKGKMILDPNPFRETRYSRTLRSYKCCKLVRLPRKRCEHCAYLRILLRQRLKRVPKSTPKSKTNVRYLSNPLQVKKSHNLKKGEQSLVKI